ncbi:hypothetical protein NPIL_526141 [Nephila pilipes]|uniref:Uncharacterized protein n=1 Tax=Nephila pilipes TaxID=299642 RepID=A0A8X6PZR5_NEPPI|nr:hypothetical protein NPIL_526141 [Nephila pilipes]
MNQDCWGKRIKGESEKRKYSAMNENGKVISFHSSSRKMIKSSSRNRRKMTQVASELAQWWQSSKQIIISKCRIKRDVRPWPPPLFIIQSEIFQFRR